MAVAFAACGDGPVNVTAFCAEHGISRQTFYVYRRRFQAEGLQGLLPRSRRPARSPSSTSEPTVQAVLAVHDRLREQGWIREGERVVLLNTGSGLVYPDVEPA